MRRRVFRRETRRVVVAEDNEQQSDEIPDADDNAIVAPATCLRDELCPQD
jgi:hypothetical protein